MFKKLLLSTLVLGAVAGCQAQAGNQATATGAGDEPLAAGARPVTDWRFSRAEMEDIASPTKLKWRVFYTKPSSGPDAAWFDAVKRGDLATVKKMVEQGQDIEAKDDAELGQTALGWAAFIGYEDMVDYLIAKGADLHATDRGDVYNTLKSAVLGKNTSIVRKLHGLLRDETDLNDQTKESDGETLIMVAASNGRLETVRYLLEQGANPDLVSEQKNQSPLSFACQNGHTEVVKFLIDKGAINHRTGKSSCQ